MGDQGIKDRLAELENRDALKELTAEYAMFTARGEIDAMVGAFTDDGRFGSVGNMRMKSELPDFFRHNVKPQERIPLVVNHILEIEGDLATGSCIMYSPWSPEGAFCGHYQDRYRKVDGAWHFTERVWSYYQNPFSQK